MQRDLSTTDEQLVSLTLKDKNYFEPLMERYEAKLLRYIKRLTGLQKEYSEDILQEVFINIFRNLNSFDTDLSFSNWAYRIAHNESLNYIRKHHGKETVALDTDNEDATNLINIFASDADVHAETIQNEMVEKVRRIIYLLPKKYKDVIILYYLEGKDYAEISDILKKPMGTIATLLSRAKNKFKDLAKKNNVTL